MKEDFYDFDIFEIPENSSSSFNSNENTELLIFVKPLDYDKHELLLTKILAAIGFDIQTNTQVIKVEDELEYNVTKYSNPKIKNVITFGLMPKELGFNASFRPNVFYATETYNVLLSFSLTQLNDKKENKLALWSALQKHFKK